MNTKKSLWLLPTMLALFGVIFVAHTPQAARATEAQPFTPVTERTGAWVDTVEISAVAETEVITQLQAGTLDMYAWGLSDAALYQQVVSDPGLASVRAVGNYNDLTFNPAGPTFDVTGKLNPFSVPAIREAMNKLVNRATIAQTIMGGLSIPKYLIIHAGQPEYARYTAAVQALEFQYAPDLAQAEAVIATEMENLGATKVNDQWYFDGEPVTLIFIIRVEDQRMQIGDYVADLLEEIGFVVDRQYKTSSEAGAIWINSNPEEGLWHLYTGGWVSMAVARDQSADFEFFYTPRGWDAPLWQAYTPAPEFDAAAAALASGNYDSMTERDELFIDALSLSMQDSVRIWLIQTQSFFPRKANTTAAYDLAGGLTGSEIWPYTARFLDQEGGTLKIGEPALFKAPWNPVAGSNWIYDSFIQQATQDDGLLADPNTGLCWPQRVASAELYVGTGTLITKTLDWVTLNFSDTIELPEDAWVDWDAANQVWITAGEKYTQTQTALFKSVVHYPAELFTTATWHDGSPISAADFVMAMILPFDIANPASPIYDESQVSMHDWFMSTFKGYRITSTDPLIIEYYSDSGTRPDAELNIRDFWPDSIGKGEIAWHNLAVGYLADAAGALAFSSDKAETAQIEWMNFIGDPSLAILEGYLDQAQNTNFIPYANTLGAFITPAEATARWSNLQAWYSSQGHFWIGAGPFYLDEVSYDNGTVTLQRYPDFPDPADKWERFSHDATPVDLILNYTAGAPGSAFNITGTNFPINSVVWIYVNDQLIGTAFTGETGDFTFTFITDPNNEEGDYFVTVSVNPTDTTKIRLDAQEPLRPIEGTFTSVELPETIPAFSYLLHLPLIEK